MTHTLDDGSQSPATASDPAPADTDAAPDQPEGLLTLTSRGAIRDISLRLARQARREILILSRELDPAYYDQQPFLVAMRRLALTTHQDPVRMLVWEPRLPVNRGHRLVGLARQLSSRISIRRLGEDFRDRSDAFLIADGRGYCLRRQADTQEAVANLNAPREARLLRAEFQQLWENSEESIELRRLHL